MRHYEAHTLFNDKNVPHRNCAIRIYMHLMLRKTSCKMLSDK